MDKCFKIIKMALLAMILLNIPLMAAQVPPPSAARLTPAVKAVRKALPWVVNIGTNEKIIQVNDPFSLFFTEFFNRQRSMTERIKYSPLGSGVIVDSRGLVLTNSHVVRRAQQLEIRLWDGSAYPATVVGYDVPNDLCLLQLQNLNGKELQAADFAHANDLLLGETVIAIGNPFGLEHSVSEGTLSAFNRSFQEGEVAFSDIIQTDAAINPGNSGGPLINLDGQLIGINLAIRADAQGIGFAIPLARIERFLTYWLKPSHFSKGYVGLAPEAAVESGDAGVVLPELLPESPLERAGFKAGDTIVSVNGRQIRRLIDFGREIWHLQPGDKLKIGDSTGKLHDLKIAAVPGEMLLRTRLGLKVEELTRGIRAATGIPEELTGVVITDVVAEPFFAMQDSEWRQAVRRGDVIAEFAGERVKSVKDILEVLNKTSAGDRVNMVVVTKRRNHYVQILIKQLTLN